MITKSIVPLFLLSLFASVSLAQQGLWRIQADNYSNSRHDNPGNELQTCIAKLDKLELKNVISSIGIEAADGRYKRGIPFSIPLPDGKMLTTSIIESPIWQENSAGAKAGVKTYQLSDPATKSSRGRITISGQTISGIIFSENGVVYIDPVANSNDGSHVSKYINGKAFIKITCGVKYEPENFIKDNNRTLSGDCMRRTYRLAVAATGEYTAWAGSQSNALNYITICLNNVNAIYNRDLNIRLQLVSTNSIIFTNAATDPYPTTPYLDDIATNTNQTVLDNILGTAAYDLGIVFNYGWDRGYAINGVVCNTNNKAKSAAGLTYGVGANPVPGAQGPTMDLTVAHEIGHQFNSTHSYSSNTGFCAGFSTLSATFEPGGGSTLMSYGGYPTCNTYTNSAELYFHAGNIAQIQAYIIGAGSCGSITTTGNHAPQLTGPGNSFNIPISTPFMLTGSGTDADENTLLYNWEQVDVNYFTTAPPAATNPGGPNFRSYAPTTAGHTRYFPNMHDLAAGNPTPYEVLSSVTRTMNFRLTARDQSSIGACTAETNTAVNVFSNAGPFVITSQQGFETWTANGTNTQNITWNVAGTNSGSVNCAQVSILFSADAGRTFPYTLVANTANDGAETIIVPNIPTAAGRIKIQSIGNIFFNISRSNITVISSCAAEGSTISPATNLSVPAGSGLLNLALSPQYGNTFIPSGTINAASPSMKLTINNTQINGWSEYSSYDATRFNVYPLVVTTRNTYTFTVPSPYGLVYNLYRDAFNPTFPCLNFLASNTVTNGVDNTTINPSVSAVLIPGIRYFLTVGTYTNTFPVLPATFSVNVTGGSIYTNPPSPGAAYSYYFVVVDNGTGLIKSVAANADLSNSSNYPGGSSYTVYGLSYSNASPSLNTFVGGLFSNLKNIIVYNPSYCGNLSKNSIQVNVLQALPTYTFTGNGNWSNAANWLNNNKPPDFIPNGCEVIIDPVGGGECLVNIPVTVLPGAVITVKTGKRLNVLGNMVIY